MVRFARLEFPTVRCPNLRFEVADARELRFDREFDAVFSNAAMHWIIDHRPVLAGIARALRSGGRILLQMGGRGNAAGLMAALDEMIPTDKWHRYFVENYSFPYGFYGPELYNQWLRDAGLTVKRVELIPKDMVHPNTEALRGWIRTTWLPFTERIPADLRPEFVDEVLNRYLRANGTDAEGCTHVRMVRLEVEATRD